MAEAIARRKLEAGLITRDEFQMIVDCDALVGFDEEGGLDGELQTSRAMATGPSAADDARQQLALGEISLQQARTIIDTHLRGIVVGETSAGADTSPEEERERLADLVTEWRRESTVVTGSTWLRWLWVENDVEVGGRGSTEDNDDNGDADDADQTGGGSLAARSSFCGKGDRSSSLCSERLDPRVEEKLVNYSDAICAFNEAQANKAVQARRDAVEQGALLAARQKHAHVLAAIHGVGVTADFTHTSGSGSEVYNAAKGNEVESLTCSGGVVGQAQSLPSAAQGGTTDDRGGAVANATTVYAATVDTTTSPTTPRSIANSGGGEWWYPGKRIVEIFSETGVATTPVLTALSSPSPPSSYTPLSSLLPVPPLTRIESSSSLEESPMWFPFRKKMFEGLKVSEEAGGDASIHVCENRRSGGGSGREARKEAMARVDSMIAAAHLALEEVCAEVRLEEAKHSRRHGKHVAEATEAEAEASGGGGGSGGDGGVVSVGVVANSGDVERALLLTRGSGCAGDGGDAMGIGSGIGSSSSSSSSISSSGEGIRRVSGEVDGTDSPCTVGKAEDVNGSDNGKSNDDDGESERNMQRVEERRVRETEEPSSLSSSSSSAWVTPADPPTAAATTAATQEERVPGQAAVLGNAGVAAGLSRWSPSDGLGLRLAVAEAALLALEEVQASAAAAAADDGADAAVDAAAVAIDSVPVSSSSSSSSSSYDSNEKQNGFRKALAAASALDAHIALFQAASESRRATWADQVAALKCDVDRSFEELENLSQELHDINNKHHASSLPAFSPAIATTTATADDDDSETDTKR